MSTATITTDAHGLYDDSWKGTIAEESWRDVPGWESFYQVSSLGRVRTKHTLGRACRKRILSPGPNGKGYLRVHLTNGKRRISSVVHRLVLLAFAGEPPSPQHETNHKDGNKANNKLENLEWVTPVENNAHSVRTGLWHPHIGEAHGRALLTENDVRVIRSSGESNKALGKRYGVTATCIYLVRKRKNWKHVK